MVQGIIAGGYDALVKSIEGAEDIPADGATEILNYEIKAEDVVLGISASSTTPYVLGALEKAKAIHTDQEFPALADLTAETSLFHNPNRKNANM